MTGRAWLVALLWIFAAGCKRTAEEDLQAGKSARFEQRPGQALEAFRRALDKLDRDGSASAQVLRARALAGAAEVYDVELGDGRRAVEVYRELVRACPESPEAHSGRIRLAALLKDRFDDARGAIQVLNDALARSPPESAELRYRVATLYFSLGDYAQAALEAAEVARRYEASAWVDDALFLQGQALQLKGRPREALAAFEGLAARFPDGALRPLALFEQGRVWAGLGERDRAVGAWLEALKSHPQPDVVRAELDRVRQKVEAERAPALGREEAFRGPGEKGR
ncbi:MAG: tetratricopeptide repeat protein [Deltaproteobacteria bacterium]|nr:tetratricopeptide repeat protein [Deltaproteobacteria bacterium]